MKSVPGEKYPAKVKKHILLWLVVVIASTTFAQKSNIKFTRITINDGLSLSSVYCIFEDRQGFMWFGTEDGLNKYDGKNFTIYRPELANQNSLTYRWIEQIYEDSNGLLWFASKSGLTSFNPEHEIFGQYRHIEGNNSSLTNDTITAFEEDQNGNLWVGTMQGLNRINLHNGLLQQIPATRKAENLSHSRIHDLVCDDDGNLWIACEGGLFEVKNSDSLSVKIQFDSVRPSTKVYALQISQNIVWAGTDKGLAKYNPSTGKTAFSGIPVCDNNVTQSQKVENIILDADKNLWVGTPEGLFIFDDKNNKFTCVVEAFDSNQSLSVNTTKPITTDSQGNLWYGTFGSGLYKIKTSPLEVVNYRNNTANPYSLSQNSINCIYEDRTGVIWFGTFGAGICVFDRYAHKFELITHDPLDTNSLSGNFIWTVIEANDGSIWVGTNREGLNRYSPKTGQFKRFDHDDTDPGSLSFSSVRKIYQDSQGTIWVGTDGGGLNRFNPETESFTHYYSDPNNQNTLSSNSIRVIDEDKSGNLWIGTRNGLNKFDKNTGICKRFLHSPENPQSISHNFIYSSIVQDRAGNLWIGTYGGGLNKMNITNETFTSYRFNPDNPTSISDDIVFSIYEDNDGILWVGTNNGLNRFDPKKETFQRFGIDQGLPNEVIYGILPDEQNNLWLSTNLGIAKINRTNFHIENFDVNDGLQSNEFNGGAFHKGKSGKLYFAGVYGLNIIKPEKLTPISNQANVVITAIGILGKEVHPGNFNTLNLPEKESFNIIEKNDQFYLPTAVSYTRKIKLDYKHRFLSFEFAALNIPPSEKIRYNYKMENMDEDWNFSGKRNYVTYANMSPGNYIFKVNAMNEAGEISPNIAQLVIIISPPYWKTWWFYLLEFFALFLFAGFIYVYLLKARTNKLLTFQNQQIQAANQKLTVSEKKLKELNDTKDKFFSIIAHDLKNPFTSLLSISDLLAKNYESLDEEDKKSGIDGFHNAAKRIYSLLENLLLWSRAQTGRVKFSPEIFNITELAEECFDLMALNAEKKGVDFHIWTDDELNVYADKEMIHTVLRNLLHNAIKYSNSGGKVVLRMREMEKGLVKITISDEGVGISEDRMQKLFNLGSKANSDGTAGEKGTGLGLIICKEFVERNGSKLLVKSKEGEGSEFSFYLEISKP